MKALLLFFINFLIYLSEGHKIKKFFDSNFAISSKKSSIDDESFIRCEYGQLATFYSCDLQIYNPEGRDDFEKIDVEEIHEAYEFVLIVRATYNHSPNVPKIICQQFMNLRRLLLSNGIISKISPENFESCGNLEMLFLDSNQISHISDNSFLHLSQLEFLRLGNNLLTTLRLEMFNGLKAELIELDLHENLIKDLPNGIFDEFISLSYVDLGHNELSRIEFSSFGNNLNVLEQIFLNENPIDAIDPNWFDSVQNLNFLNLSGAICVNSTFNNIQENRQNVRNQLQTCFDNFDESFIECSYVFSGPNLYCNLRILNLNGRDFEQIEGILPPLTTYNDIHSIFSVGQSSINFPSIICRQFSNLKSIIMIFGIIQAINQNSFEDCKILEELSLDFNEIYQISDDSFINLSKLNSLTLEHNLISSLRPEMLNGIQNSLINLDLKDNFISSIPFEMFNEFQQLKNIYFAYNDLETIDSRSFGNSLSNLENFWAENNQIFSIDPFWFDNATILNSLQVNSNICVDENFESIKENREHVRSQLEQCFENFNNPPETTTTTPDDDFIGCIYHLSDEGEVGCELFIKKSNRLDDFTEIEGELPTNKTFADVSTVFMAFQQTPIIPSIICQTFFNLQLLGTMGSGVIEISENSIQNCKNLTTFYVLIEFLDQIPENLFVNQANLLDFTFGFTLIEELSEKLFENNFELQEVYLGYNQLSELPLGLFANNQKLKTLSIEGNQIEVIDFRSFHPSNDLFMFDAKENQINAIDSQWFDFSLNLDQLDFTNNICVDEIFLDVALNREEIKNALESCFENFENPTETTTAVIPDEDFIRCEYYLDNFDGRLICFLSIKMSNTLDDFTEIEGELPANKTFDDVKEVYIIYQQTPIIPSIVCQTFNFNLSLLFILDSGIIELSTNSIQNCKNLTHFQILFEPLTSVPEDLFTNQLQLYEARFEVCKITKLSGRLFENNPILREVYLSFNRLTELPFGLFTNNLNLRFLSIDGNRIEVIDSRSFRPSNDLFAFAASENRIKAIDSEWFDFSPVLDQLFFANNICINEMIYYAGSSREEVRKAFEICFENFNNLN